MARIKIKEKGNGRGVREGKNGNDRDKLCLHKDLLRLVVLEKYT